ncbi:MAG: polyprenyl synthetase family protein [Streptococcaceae bacterium]|nr:polyprenyl synthetase family protein [Streptococcaceae bacterium]
MTKLNSALEKFYLKTEIPVELRDSVLYSIEAGGKRIRPVLFLELLAGFGIELAQAHYQAAAAIELIHTGSLIHDDLPAMDNDDYRRGKASNHKVFGETLAILAGDALFLDPYYLLASCDLPAETIVSLVRELSAASGSLGMVAGQVLDMLSEGKTLSLSQLENLHELKTGRMLTFPFVAAGYVSGRESQIEILRKVGEKLGLAFQIRDDILDVSATIEEIGKTPGKDVLEDKSTYVSLLGLNAAKKELMSNLNAAREVLRNLQDFDSAAVLSIIEGLEIE